jgi:LuxR family maltose regulon positive regulatory protein
MLAGHVAELRVRDLAFTQAELAEMAKDTVPDLRNEDLGKVWERTEGWPVAIRLFFLAIREGADRDRLLDEIASQDTDLAEYLSEEVLRGQPEELRTFLICTSILDQFNEGVCSAIVPAVDALAMLDLAERNNLFILKIESGSGWFRYHPIFRQCLIGQFERLPRQRQAEIRRDAGRWFEQQGYLAEAVDMALLSGDAGHARTLLAALAPDLVSVRGDLATFLQLLRRFPRGMIDEDPTLLYWQAWAMFFSRHYREAAQLVARLHQVAQTLSTGKLDGKLRVQIGLLDTLSATFTDDMASAKRTGSDWLSNCDGADPFDRATVACALVLAHLAFLDVPAARRAYDLAQRAIANSSSHYGAAWVCGIGMTMDLVAGEPREALARLDGLGESWFDAPGTPSNISSTLALLAAAAHYHLGQVEQAERLISDNVHMLTEHGVSETAAFGLAGCLRVSALNKGPATALTTARKMEAALSKAYASRLAFSLRYERVLLLFRSGRVEDAIEEASTVTDIQPLGERRAEEGDPELPCVRELRQLVSARVAISDRAWNEALRILNSIVSSARHGGRNLRLVHALILKAAVHYGQSDTVKAVRAVLDAVAVAKERGLMQIFLDDARICRPLIAAALASSDQVLASRNPDEDFLRELQERLGIEAHLAGKDEQMLAPLEPLTAREQLMVDLLHSGLRNREIAGHLSMSEATVKWHLYNLYSKLGVNNRTAAIHRARSLGLVGK